MFKKWSYILLIVVFTIDLILVLVTGKSMGLGAGLVDVGGIILAIMKIKN